MKFWKAKSIENETVICERSTSSNYQNKHKIVSAQTLTNPLMLPTISTSGADNECGLGGQFTA
jgi:hypothetical protein